MSKSGEDTPRTMPKREAKKIRRINPLGMRVVIRILDQGNVTDGGLYLPEGAKKALDESLLGEVIEVASAVDHDTHEEANVSGVPLGATVLVSKNVGIKVPWDDTLRVIETKDVLAIVDEVHIS